jgi:hypothetical protein
MGNVGCLQSFYERSSAGKGMIFVAESAIVIEQNGGIGRKIEGRHIGCEV